MGLCTWTHGIAFYSCCHPWTNRTNEDHLANQAHGSVCKPKVGSSKGHHRSVLQSDYKPRYFQHLPRPIPSSSSPLQPVLLPILLLRHSLIHTGPNDILTFPPHPRCIICLLLGLDHSNVPNRPLPHPNVLRHDQEGCSLQSAVPDSKSASLGIIREVK